MKRICHLTSAHASNDIRIFYKQCKTLASAGYDLTLVVQHKQDEVVSGIRIRGIEEPKNRSYRMVKTVEKVYQQAIECDADIYHFHDPELIPVGLKLKKRGKKVIYDAHEDLPRQIMSKPWIPAPLRKMVSWTVEIIENYGARRFDYILTATPFIKERFLGLNKQTMDINNYPLLSELHIPNTDWDRKEKIVCYVGGIGLARGIDEMVDAIALSKYSMLLAGEFASSTERNRLITKREWNKVKELGYVNREEVKRVLSRSMAGLVLFHPEPNHINAQPNKLFEYMSAGIPVIASNFPLWKDIIEGNNCGICVDPLKISEIANAIDWIIDNPEQAKQMGENGRKAVEDKYNWEQESKKLIKVYERLDM